MEDLVAERAILSAIFQNGQSVFDEVSDLINVSSFTDDLNQIIYKTFEEIFKRNPDAKIDYPLLISTANDLGFKNLDDILGTKYIRSLMNHPTEGENAVILAGKLRILEIRRKLVLLHDDSKRKIINADKSTSIDEILAISEQQITDYILKLNNNEEYSKLGEGLLEWVQDKINNPNQVIGISSGLEHYDKAIGRLRRKAISVIGARPKQGKAQTLDSIIYTPNGPITMGDVKIGDIICDANGGTCRVIGVHPQGIKDIYEVTFTDNDKVYCCDEHLWEVSTSRFPVKLGTIKKKQNKYIVNTENLKNTLYREKNRPRWYVRLSNPVHFNHQKVEIPPYLMGVLIGDGGITHSITYINTDEELINKVNTLLDEKYNSNKVKNTIRYGITKGKNSTTANIYKEILTKYGLFGCNSHTKFIPKKYLYNSVQCRIELFKGLMDTDGSIYKDGSCEYSTTSHQLALDVKELVNSLGGLAKISTRYTTCGSDKCNKCKSEEKHFSYRLGIKFNNTGDIFFLDRKLQRGRVRKKPELKRRINNIKYIGKKECQCISVDSVDNLYLTNHFIPTHNSILTDFFALKIGGAQNIPTLILDTEMTKEDHFSRMLASMTSVETYQIETGEFVNDQVKLQRVKLGAEKLSKAPITYQSIPGKDINQVISVMKKWVRKDVGFDENGRTKDCIIIYDYLKLVDSKDMASMAEYQAIGFLMTSLHNFAHKYDVPIIAFVQLNRDGIEKESSDIVSQSDRIIWLCSNFSILKPKTEDEIVEDGGKESGNRKLMTILARHGPGMEGDWLNLNLEKEFTRIKPAKTQRQIYQEKNSDGFTTTENKF